jgi:hypothetical protein
MHLREHDCDLLLAGLTPREPWQAHLDGCGACTARLAEATAAHDRFLAHNPPALRVDELLAKRPRSRWWGWAAGLGATLAAAAAAVIVLLAPADPGVRLKGDGVGCRLVRAGQVVSVLRPGEPAPAREGDDVMCSVAPRAEKTLAVWGIDETGAAEPLLTTTVTGPRDLDSSFAVHGRGRMVLAFVWSEARLSDATLRAALAVTEPDLVIERITLDVSAP